MRLRSTVALAIVISLLHWITYTVLWGSAFALGTGSPEDPLANVLGTCAEVLGTPLMHLLLTGPSFFTIEGERWWGDDTNLILGLSAINASIWGGAIAWLVHRLRSRVTEHDTRAV
jgi:hypothetical protein